MWHGPPLTTRGWRKRRGYSTGDPWGRGVTVGHGAARGLKEVKNDKYVKTENVIV